MLVCLVSRLVKLALALRERMRVLTWCLLLTTGSTILLVTAVRAGLMRRLCVLV